MCRRALGLACVFALSSFGLTATAQTSHSSAATTVPRVLPVTGTIRLAAGSPAPVEIVTFAIYADETGGEPLWQETQNVNVDSSGYYSTLLGSAAPDGLPLDVFATSQARWLGIRVQRVDEPEQPRMRFASVPYALRASDADTLGGRPPSAYLLADPGGASGGTRRDPAPRTTNPPAAATSVIAGQVTALAKFTSATDLASSNLWDLGGTFGVNTLAPRDVFDVHFANTAGSMTGYAVQNLGNTATSYSGMLFYDQNGALGQFQGFNNVTHEYRINNIASGGSINFMIGGSSKFLVGNSGDISIAGSLLKGGVRFLHNAGTSTFGGLNSGNFTMTGAANTGFGSSVLAADTTGFRNVAFGTSALQENTNGSNNTGVGYLALLDNTAGDANTAIGAFALELNDVGILNTAVGNAALVLSTASNNTAVGAQTLVSNSTACCNTAVGAHALNHNTTGTSNTALGYLAGFNATTGINNIYIGTDVVGVAGESNTMYLGKVGTQTKTLIAGVRGATTGVADAVSVVIDSTGQLGTINSSRRYKEDIQDMGDASSGLMKLRPVTYRYKQAYADGTKPIDYGLIAEEVEQVYPDLVAHLADGDVETVQYQKINAMLLNEVQKQHTEIAALKARLDALERERR